MALCIFSAFSVLIGKSLSFVRCCDEEAKKLHSTSNHSNNKINRVKVSTFLRRRKKTDQNRHHHRFYEHEMAEYFNLALLPNVPKKKNLKKYPTLSGDSRPKALKSGTDFVYSRITFDLQNPCKFFCQKSISYGKLCVACHQCISLFFCCEIGKVNNANHIDQRQKKISKEIHKIQETMIHRNRLKPMKTINAWIMTFQ